MAVGGVFVLFAATSLLDWNFLRGPVSGMLSASLGRPVRIEGPLNVDLFTLNPRAEAQRIVIGNPDWARAAGVQGDNLTIAKFSAETRLFPFLFGDHTFTRIELERPIVNLFRDNDGRATWNFGAPAKSEKPFSLPPIQRFILRDGRLSLRDQKRDLNLSASLNSTETADGGPRPFALNGAGTINGEPFLVEGAGGPLLNIRRDQPYAFRADIRAGPTRVRMNGRMDRPFNFGKLSAGVRVTGADLAHLYLLTGITLPNTQPYNLTAQMRRDNARVAFTQIDGDHRRFRSARRPQRRQAGQACDADG